MAYTMKTEGADEIVKMLKAVGDAAEKISGQALYKGAGVMSEAISKEARSIPTAPFHYAVFLQRKPSPEEKKIVTDARVGIAKFDREGYNVQTSVGYGNAGYGYIKGKRKAVPQIANAINSGTSFMPKQPFFRMGVSRGERSASEAMIKEIEAEVTAIANGGKTT